MSLESVFAVFAIGWFFGSVGMYAYIVQMGLFRSPREYYADRERRGLPVPENWRDTHPEGE